MLKHRPLLVAAGLFALLAGCATPPEAPTEDDYQPPPAGAPVAYLKGTHVSEGGLFGDEHTAYVYMIDLKSVPAAAEHWNDPIALAPGKRSIMAEYHVSNFKARTSFVLTAGAGASYQLMIRPGHENTPDQKLYCDFWIVDTATGKPVVPIHHAQVTGGKKGTIFNIPS